jgi:hypothetical protein
VAHKRIHKIVITVAILAAVLYLRPDQLLAQTSCSLPSARCPSVSLRDLAASDLSVIDDSSGQAFVLTPFGQTANHVTASSDTLEISGFGELVNCPYIRTTNASIVLRFLTNNRKAFWPTNGTLFWAFRPISFRAKIMRLSTLC